MMESVPERRVSMIKPMLCESRPPFDSSEYLWEIKWDGERAIVFYKDGKISIQSRKGQDVTFRYPELQGLGKGMNCKECVLDGEIVVLNENGKSVFSLLQQRAHLEKRLLVSPSSSTEYQTFSQDGLSVGED